MRKIGILAPMTRAILFMRTVSCVVMAALLLLVVQPGLARAELKFPLARVAEVNPDRPIPSNREGTVMAALNRALVDVAGLDTALAAEPDAGRRAERIKALQKRLTDLDREVGSGFDAVDAMLQKGGVPQAVRERQQAARRQYRERMKAVLDGLSAGEPGARAKALQALGPLTEPALEGRPHQPLDPTRLPFGRVKGEARKPGETPEAFKARFGDLKVDLKAARLPLAKAAALVAPQPGDLQATEDVQLTAEIRALAFELGNNPLKIYNWVHDNVELVPTYGSIRGSQRTLLSKRGNAFDVASLLIALLRASNVPARYALGTVQVPADKLANWLGGTENPAVTQQLLGQGGIPNVGVQQGSQVTQIRLEHVWVEAWVDYIPGRGAKTGPGDTWIPLDAGLKQHQLTADRGVLAAVPFDLAAFSNTLLQGAQFDPVLGKISGVDVNVGYNAVESWQQSLQDYTQANGIPSTQDALLGGAAIVPSDAKVLPASLPYQVVVRASAVSTLPASLRLGVTLNGYASIFDQALGSPSFTYHVSLPALGNHRLGLTFPPATDADAQVIQTARANHASSLPVYLIQVKPSVTLDGVTVASGGAVGMGSIQPVDVVLEDVDGPATVPYQLVAGDEAVVGLNGDGVDEAVVQDRFSRVPADTAAENMQQVALHYWLECDTLDALAAKGLKVHALRRYSVGLFSTPLNVSTFFGAPRSGVYQSRIMDVKRSFVGAAGSTPDLVRSFVRTSGRSGSFLEGSVFDQLFGRPRGRGISAMQLLFDAGLGGVPIYQITSSNAAAVLPLLRVSSAVKADISTAVSQGKTVVIPESDVQHDNYRGAGYIVEDPETGAAGYLISGGLAGGGLFDCLPDLVPILVIILAIILIAILLWWLWPFIAGALAGLGAAGAPAFASLLAAIAALFVSAGPAYASSGGGGGSGSTGSCTCPPCPANPPCEVDVVPPSRPHFPCPGTHWHYQVYNQRPYPDCTCFISSRLFGGCIPPPLPVPCP